MPFERSAGILLHPTSLPSLSGIGDLGPEAYAFTDFLSNARLGIWQVLPLSPPGLGNSPYSAISAFAGNPLLISLERLADRGWIGKDRIKGMAAPRAKVDFEEVIATKLPLLRGAAQNFLEGRAGDLKRFETFKKEQAWWLEDFVLFDVMRQHHAGATWSSWITGLAQRDPQSMHEFGLDVQTDLEAERAIQLRTPGQIHASPGDHDGPIR